MRARLGLGIAILQVLKAVMLGMLLVLSISVGNLLLGFALAVLLGQGPRWAERFVPAAVRERLS